MYTNLTGDLSNMADVIFCVPEAVPFEVAGRNPGALGHLFIVCQLLNHLGWKL